MHAQMKLPTVVVTSNLAQIAQRLTRESPSKATMMATLANGAPRSGYIPDEASFGKQTFEVLASRLRPDCAESGIVNGIVSLIDSARDSR
jgi:neutral ceramidase